jgi:hypothetical protein
MIVARGDDVLQRPMRKLAGPPFGDLNPHMF